MIWIYVITAIFFLALAGFICLWYFNKHMSTLGGLCVGLVIMTLTALGVVGLNQITSDITNKTNLAVYDELMLYYDVVNESNDELLRWDYHSKCQKWNSAYEDWLMGRQSSWCSAFYGRYDFDGCDFIRLELRRD